MHIPVLNGKLKLRNLTVLISQEIQENIYIVPYLEEKCTSCFNMFQILTTNGEGMLVGNPAPRASRGSPVPVMALQGS